MLELRNSKITTPGGRVLFDGLDFRLEREHVALIGRNGVGKSTLLAALAEAGDVHWVPQTLPAAPMSHGEHRRVALMEARLSRHEALLLDEPTEDLDEEGVAWLRAWLPKWHGPLVVASHDRRLLADFEHFFIASESGCRYFHGTLAELDEEMAEEHARSERDYVRGLKRLVRYEEHTLHIARRKARKKRYGRCKELDRNNPRILLNSKRNQAQVSHGRLAKIREERLAAVRDFTKASRRALSVNLSFDLPIPVVDGDSHTRTAVIGPNGAGKTTLLRKMLARADRSKVGSIEQGGADWMLDDALIDLVDAELIAAHKFPLALAQRPLRSLSPGERSRAALIVLFHRAPEKLVLDEPTFSLDLVGQRAIIDALRAWPGSLVVTSHDRSFLEAIGVDEVIELSKAPSTAPSASRASLDRLNASPG